MLRRRHQPAGATRAGDGGGGGAAASLSALALLLLLAAAVPSAQAQALSISSTNSADRGEPIVVEGFRYSSGNVSTRLGHGRYSAPLKWLYTPPPYIQARVAANNGTAFVATTALADSQLYYLALDNGDNRWNTGLGGMGIEQPVVHGDYLFAIGGNTPCVLWFYTANYRPSCGWTWNDKRSVNFMLSSVTVNPTKKLVYVTSMVSNYKGTTLTTVFAVNIEGDQAGEHRWMSTVANNTAHGPTTAVKPMTPVYDPHTNYVVVAAGKNLVALNALTGDTVWTNTLSDTSISAPPTITDGIVVIGTGEGVKACCIETGVIMWSIGTQSDPSQVALFTDGTGRIAYTTTSWKHEVGTQPAGFHVLNSAHLEYSGPFTALDACASPGLIAKIPGKFDEPDGCKAACSQNYCNATAFTWFATEQACKCRLDTLWVPVTNNEAVSGQWSAPSSNWSLTNERLGWSMPVVDGSTVYVTAINTTHEIVMALGEAPNDTAEILWMHSTHINNALWIQPGPPTLSTSTLTLVVGSNNGSIFSYCVDDSTPAPPDVPVPDKPWYKQTAYLLGIALGLVSLGLILYCCVCTSVSHTLDSPASKYQMVSRLGSGSYGVVYLVRHRTNKALCALKYLNCDSDESQERALLEFTTMRTFQGHPNMIRVLETFMNWKDCSDETGKDVRKSPSAKTSEESRALLSPAGFRPDEPLSEMKKFTSPKYVCLLMPFYKQGDLKSFAQRHSGPMPEELLLDFAAQVSSLLQYFHARDEPLLHRDLKPENILVSDDGKSVVVTDFGLAKKMQNQYCCTRAGTLCYMAPECWAHHYGKESDVWAMGCILYAVAMKRLDEHNIRVMFSDALQLDGFQKGVADELRTAGYPVLAKLVSALLEPDYHHRPGAADVLTWMHVPKYNAEFPELPIRAPTAQINIPPLVTRFSPRASHRSLSRESSASRLSQLQSPGASVSPGGAPGYQHFSLNPSAAAHYGQQSVPSDASSATYDPASPPAHICPSGLTGAGVGLMPHGPMGGGGGGGGGVAVATARPMLAGGLQPYIPRSVAIAATPGAGAVSTGFKVTAYPPSAPLPGHLTNTSPPTDLSRHSERSASELSVHSRVSDRVSDRVSSRASEAIEQNDLGGEADDGDGSNGVTPPGEPLFTSLQVNEAGVA